MLQFNQNYVSDLIPHLEIMLVMLAYEYPSRRIELKEY